MSTMQIEIHGYFPAGELKILLGVYNSSFPDNPTIYPKLIKMGDWEVGNEDDDNDIYQYPAGFTLDFKTDLDDDDFINLVTDLQANTVIVEVTKNGDPIFDGSVYNSEKSMTVDFRKQIISLKIVDQITGLKTVDPRTNPYNYNIQDATSLNAGNTVLINDLIMDLLNRPPMFNYINGVVNLCNYQAHYNGQYYGVNSWCVMYKSYFSPNVPYTSISDVLRSLLNTMCCKGYIGFDRKFYIVPRNYSPALGFKTIPNENISDDWSIDIIRKMLGLQAFVFNDTGSNNYDEYDLGTLDKTNGDLTYPDLVLQMHFEIPVGFLPGKTMGGLYGLFIKTSNGSFQYAELNRCRKIMPDGTFSNDSSLWLLSVNDLWSISSINRPIFGFKISPTKTNGYSDLITYLRTNDFFKIDSMPNRLFLPRWLSYSWNDDIIDVKANQ